MISLSLSNPHVKTLLYSAWFCPFAQRAWCALNELGVTYQLVESLQVDPTTQTYIKDPGLLQANPKGLVPTLVQEFDDNGEHKLIVSDSMEILKDLYCAQIRQQQQQQQQEPHDDNHHHNLNNELMAVQHLYEEAMEWNKVLCSNTFYSVLMKQTKEEQTAAWQDLVQGLAAFAGQLDYHPDDHSISFYKSEFASGTTPSMVDFCVFPFLHRLYIMEHYKHLTVPTTTPQQQQVANKLKAWQTKMESLPSVQQTLASRQDLIPIYLRYADGTAQSKVGESIRQGTNVHNV